MEYSLEKELSDNVEKFYSEWKEEGVTLRKTRNFYFNAKEKYLSSSEEVKTQEAKELILKIFFTVGKISNSFIKKWQDGKHNPTSREIDLLKEGCSEVLAAFENHFREELTFYYAKKGKQFSTHHEEVKRKIQQIRELLQ